jgi:outer membrane protein assembly factor BamE (lipoprotein component of BamABCDE complex)
MKLSTRGKFILVGVLVTAAMVGLMALERSTRPDAASAIRNRLLGESPRGVELVLGPPSYREKNDKTWHYTDTAVVGRVADRAVADQTLIVEFDAEGAVSSVYLSE